MLTVSDANPLHFVDEDATVFNEEEKPNVLHACFFDTWKCTSEVRTRIMDDEGDKVYSLRIINARTGVQIGADIPFVVTPIVNDNVSQPQNNDFDLELDPWVANEEVIGLGDADWEWSANQGGSARVSLATPSFIGSTDKSKDLRIDFSLVANRTYKFRITGECGEPDDQRIRVYVRNSATAYNTFAEITTGGNFVHELSVTPTEDCNQLIITGENLTDDGISFLELSKVELVDYSFGGIHDISFTPQVLGLCGLPTVVKIVDVTDEEAEVVLKKTDELNFDEDSNWTLIQYKAENDFVGMPYDENSPYFQMYLPIQFFRERNKMEVVSAKLSGGITVNTGSYMDRTRRMMIDNVPDYKHNKFLIILQHAVNGSLLIDGHEWVIGENSSYEYKDPPTDDYPLQGAEIYLNRKNYATSNIN